MQFGFRVELQSESLFCSCCCDGCCCCWSDVESCEAGSLVEVSMTFDVVDVVEVVEPDVAALPSADNWLSGRDSKRVDLESILMKQMKEFRQEFTKLK
jgi:hypothetical protein